jgi:thiosulfate/3-mercaptopyruvate sulfurtransferase
MRDPNAVISTGELAALLHRADVRVYDCTTYNNPPPPGVDQPYIPVPGLATFREAHIPGADFLDLQGEFSDNSQRHWFMMPKDVAQLETAFARHGIGEGVRVVLYSIGSMMWSTRFWWMLRSLGFDNAAVLDGGFDKWKAEGRVTESGDPKGYPAATFKARSRPGLFVDKHETMAAIRAAGTVIVNALGPQFHRGLEPSRYGRPGRVPGSVNVSAATLIDPATKSFTTLADAAEKFAASGVTKDRKVICYCGGGISATVDLFLMHQLGYDDLTLYDGSMGEWAKEPNLPIETG